MKNLPLYYSKIKNILIKLALMVVLFLNFNRPPADVMAQTLGPKFNFNQLRNAVMDNHFSKEFQSKLHYTQSSAMNEDKDVHPRERPVGINILHYDLTLKFNNQLQEMDGQANLTFKNHRPQTTHIILNATEFEIKNIKDDQDNHLFYHYDQEELLIYFNAPISQNEIKQITINYTVNNPRNLYRTGIDPTDPSRMEQAYTFSQPEGMQNMIPSIDRPNDKATFDIKIELPRPLMALSNGKLVEEKHLSSVHFFHYKMDKPMATYLLNIVIGSYEKVDLGQVEGTQLWLWTPPNLKEKAIFDTLPTYKMMQVFNNYLGIKYPFDEYGQVIAQSWRTSMEHQSLTTMGGWRISGDRDGEGVVAHELAHQWFGDWVTCETWGDLWLNEGFASFLPRLYFLSNKDFIKADIFLDNWRRGYFDESKNMVHPLSQISPKHDDIFDLHAYYKGALVIRYMRYQSNQWIYDNKLRINTSPSNETENFSKVLKTYLSKHGGKNVRSSHLQNALEEVTQQSWNTFFGQWVYSSGHPIISANWSIDDQGIVSINLVQQQVKSNHWRTFSFPLQVEFIGSNGQHLIKTIELFKEEDHFRFNLPFNLAAINLDPQWIIPGQFFVKQTYTQWKKIFIHSKSAFSRLMAINKILANPEFLDEEISNIEDLFNYESSPYNLVRFLEKLATLPIDKYFNLINKLMDRIKAIAPSHSFTESSLAQTDTWIRKSQIESQLASLPSEEEIEQWKEQAEQTILSDVKNALWNRLLLSDNKQAIHQYFIGKFDDPTITTKDRNNLLLLLLKHKGPEAKQFIKNVLSTGSLRWVQEIQKQIKDEWIVSWEDIALLMHNKFDQSLHPRFFEIFLELIGRQQKLAPIHCPFIHNIKMNPPQGFKSLRNLEKWKALVHKVEGQLRC